MGRLIGLLCAVLGTGCTIPIPTRPPIFDEVSCEGADRVVDPSNSNASDANTCGPWDPCATIATALLFTLGGEELCVMPGLYNERVWLSTGGAAAETITVRAAQAAVMPDGSLAEVDLIAQIAGVEVSGPTPIRIEGFRIRSAAPFEDDNWPACAAIAAHDGNVTIDSVHILGAVCNGVRIEGGGPDARSSITNSRIDDTGFRAIEAAGDGLVVEDNLIFRVTYRETFADACEVPEADGIGLRGSDARIRGNRFEDLGRHLDHAPWNEAVCGVLDPDLEPVPHVDCLQAPAGADGLIFEQNRCFFEHDAADVGESSPGHAVIVRSPAEGLVVRNNVFGSAVAMPVSIGAIGSDVAGARITNNTFVRLGEPTTDGVALNLTEGDGGAITDLLVSNNLFVDQDSEANAFLRCGYDCASEVTLESNLVWYSRPRPDGFYEANPGDVLAAPTFADAEGRDFRLVPGSPGNGDGADLSGLGYDVDLEGAPRTVPWDMGVYEAD
ncbi:MAG: hypothetical protein GY898_03305 [Proteobacteria bacterium]|nr:hypothetical protein [Pseudomonadota bacterium]